MSVKIHYCHVGYAPAESKTFLIAFSEGDVLTVGKSAVSVRFKILDFESRVVYEGLAEKIGTPEYTGELLYKGDFSTVKNPGRYRIVLDDFNSESHLFEISDEWLKREVKANIKSFYYQRSGIELPAKYAGAWARPAAHLDDALEFHPTMNRPGVWNAHGGWYDAGDYGKYIVNGGVSVATLMLACELRKDSGFVGGASFKESFEQPVSLLDEVRFELEFFLRMQDDDGGVFFKVTPYRWDGFVTPSESDASQKRYILGKSTSSALNFAGALAQAHHVYADVDSEFAEKCLFASIRAYLWAEKNPEVEWPHNTEGSGGYGDPDLGDDFFWARAMLYRELKNVESIADVGVDDNGRTECSGVRRRTWLGMLLRLWTASGVTVRGWLLNTPLTKYCICKMKILIAFRSANLFGGAMAILQTMRLLCIWRMNGFTIRSTAMPLWNRLNLFTARILWMCAL